MDQINAALDHLHAAIAAELRAEAKSLLKWALGELLFARDLYDEPNARAHYLGAAHRHIKQARGM